MTAGAVAGALPAVLAEAVRTRIRRMRAERVIERIWERDHTVWQPEPTEISNRLGWLDAPSTFRAAIPRLREFATRAAADGSRVLEAVSNHAALVNGKR